MLCTSITYIPVNITYQMNPTSSGTSSQQYGATAGSYVHCNFPTTQSAKRPTRQRKEQGKRESEGVVDESVSNSNRYNLRPRRSLYSPSNDNKSSHDDSTSENTTLRSFNSRRSYK